MALRALMLKKKIDDKTKELEALRAKDADFEKREAELTQAIEEASTDEERSAVESEIETYEAEKADHESAKANLESEVRAIETELDEVETENTEEPEAEPAPETRSEKVDTEVKKSMEIRELKAMNTQERDAFFEREDVHAFMTEVRDAISQKRALTNVGLTIPEVMLPMLKEVITKTSKLISKVYCKPVAGKSRQIVMGSIPEAVWTEACGILNELTLGFNDVEVDGYKVGGYFAVCNAVLEDNDVNLASELITALGKSIGKALDAAIVYGTGTKMPLGFVTRLAQTSAPADYSATERAWVDLHTSNIATGTGVTGENLFKEIITNAQAIVNDYFEDGITWIMNQKTYTTLLQNSMGKNSNAAIVAGMANGMPIIGGDIVILPFIPDNNIAYGYMEGYLLAERAGTAIAQSEHVRFINDQTVFKGTARYDGKPVIAEAFGLMSINTTAPTTTRSFPADTAN